MVLRLYIDEDSASHVLRSLLEQSGIDALSTQTAGMSGASDEAQLEYARVAGRVILSANRKDFARLHTHWMQAGRDHAGIIILARRDLPITRIARELASIGREREAQDFVNALLFISLAKA